ncbi:hypothetical protein SAMN05216241_101140 [Limimonas halophila]|uniref:Ammonia monooxygenase n=1 Tax=Limimonas halophila TaxID=1082479 RepID=A0A1G7L6K9_9PROT|nr:AbrB family transcriptional regulator [Limimonas halophila]SDF45157.1 hypothetical protein SAMN05216241_101140 [Limimonas halophila]
MVLPRLALALAIGSLGGWLASLASVPLPWLLGSMVATTLAATAGIPVAAWTPLRSLYIAVLGVLLGSGFTPDAFSQADEWGLSIAVLVVYTLTAGLLGMAYFRRVAGFDRTTSYFAAMPGGLSEMVFMGEALGGDVRTISLTHAARVLVVVLVLPVAFQTLMGFDTGGRGLPGPDLLSLGARNIAVLLGCGLFGWAGARALRLPAAPILGPMALSAAVHLAGVTEVGPPAELVATAQIVVGSAVGARFAGTPPATIARIMGYAAGGTVVLLAATLGFAALAAAITRVELPVLILAYAPGGLAEMSLIALALGTQASFVATHHIVRIVLVIGVAPGAYRLARHVLDRRQRAG